MLLSIWSELWPKYHISHIQEYEYVQTYSVSLASVSQWVGAVSPKPKGYRVTSQLGHKPNLRVGWPVETCTRGSQSKFLFPFLPLSEISKHVLGWGLGEKTYCKCKSLEAKRVFLGWFLFYNTSSHILGVWIELLLQALRHMSERK